MSATKMTREEFDAMPTREIKIGDRVLEWPSLEMGTVEKMELDSDGEARYSVEMDKRGFRLKSAKTIRPV